MRRIPPALLDGVRRLHADADEASAAVARPLTDRLRCDAGCAECCIDELTVFEIEAARIRAEFADVLKQPPHAEGACAFLDEADRCRVYAARPYVCRTQGLPLRWLAENDDGELVEYRDICPLNDEGNSIVDLDAEACFTLGPFEQRLRRLQTRAAGDLRRTALRDLFKMS